MKAFDTTLVVISMILIGILLVQSIQRVAPNDRPLYVDVIAPQLSRPHETLDLPEYRPPPIQKYYRPQAPHQVGLLKGAGEQEDVRPIYAKPTRGHRDRFHYWTTKSDGHNNYSVPLTVGDRDCTEDIGCHELFGNEDVRTWDSDNQFKSHIYRSDMWF